MIILGVCLWVFVGFLLMIMAGRTYKFAERHFDPIFMLILGPLGAFAWRWCEKLEEKRNKR